MLDYFNKKQLLNLKSVFEFILLYNFQINGKYKIFGKYYNNFYFFFWLSIFSRGFSVSKIFEMGPLLLLLNSDLNSKYPELFFSSLSIENTYNEKYVCIW